MCTLITGGSGLVGRHLRDILPDAVYVDSKYYDLTNYKEAALLVIQERPKRIIHLAARVGGILDNQKYPCDYYEQNMLINTNLLLAARRNDVKRFTAVLSTCAYPDTVDRYPISEDQLHAGPPTTTNFGYGIAKRAMATHIDVCNEQYGTKYNYLIPCNLYGYYDNYKPESSHYVAALIRKIHEAEKEIQLFGSGAPLRQFMFAGDLTRAIKEMIQRDITESFNVATPEVYSIAKIAEIAIQSTGKELSISYDDSKPDGQFRKDVDIAKFRQIFPDFEFTMLSDGIRDTYKYYRNSQI